MMKSTRGLEKKSIPLGLSKASFFRKMKDPNAKKPWQAVNLLSTGSIDVTPTWGPPPVMFDPSRQVDTSRPLPPQGIIGMPTDYSVLLTKRRQQEELATNSGKNHTPSGRRISSSLPTRPRDILRQLNRNEIGIDSVGCAEVAMAKLERGIADLKAPSSNQLQRNGNDGDSRLDPSESDSLTADPVASLSTVHNFISKSLNSQTRTGESKLTELQVRRDGSVAERAGISSAVIPFGDKLRMTVTDVVENTSGAIPLPLQNLTRSPESRRESIRLSGDLDKIFKKIIRWNEDLQDLRQDEVGGPQVSGYGEGLNDGGVDDPRPQLQPAKKYESMSDKLKYGALMTPMENDKFALENKIAVAGRHFEKKFSDWAAKSIVDSAVEERMAEVEENKSSLIMDQHTGFKIPKMNHDCCSGCGSIFQAEDANQFGFVKPGAIENYIVANSRVVKARAEYGDRMAELQDHWDKNGKRVGEEWLDFMTDEEFKAIYRHKDRAFICNRCFTLSHEKGPSVLLKSHPTLTAPDFTEKLQALREKRCLVVLVCDITDFPGSMVYDLPGLISMNNPVIIVLNKLDCIQERAPNYKGSSRYFSKQMVTERYLREWATGLMRPFNIPRHLVKDILPVSAKRGWNINRLIESIEKHSNLSMTSAHARPLPTYFVGVSNVGKSMLLNCIAHALYRPEAPHPLSKKTYYVERDPKTGKEVILYRWVTPKGASQGDAKYMKSFRTKEASSQLTVSNLPGTTVETTAIKIATRGRSRDKNDKSDLTTTNFFDTPGLHPHWYHTSPLTLLEIGKGVIRHFRNPPCYLLREGFTFHFGGVAAIDVMKASCESVVIAAYSSKNTQHGAVKSERSDGYWAEQLGNKLTPPYSLDELAGLRLTVKKSYLFECYGRHKETPKADIYFCGLGWVSFYVSNPTDLVLRVRTLPGIVHGVREPLRKNDMKAKGHWPTFVPGSNSPFDALPSLKQIVRLTNKPIEEDENTADASERSSGVKPVLKARAREDVVGSNDPLDDLEKELGATMSF